MRFTLLLLLAPLAVFAAPLEILPLDNDDGPVPNTVPTVQEAAVQARRLLRSEAVATLSTVFPKGEPHGLDGQPIGLMDYYADCSENGNPTLLAVGIATSFKNAKAGSPVSLSIREHTKSWSAASQPRLSLIGHLSAPITSNSTEASRLKQCFVARHPDARIWSPGNRIHDSEWVTFEVEALYWVGGFGNVAYIGYIPLDLYSRVTLEEIGETCELRSTLQAYWKGFKSLFGGAEL